MASLINTMDPVRIWARASATLDSREGRGAAGFDQCASAGPYFEPSEFVIAAQAA